MQQRHSANPCVVIMAGGTGGHVFPALTVAEKLQAMGVDVHWLGTRAGIESRLVPAANIDITYMPVSGVRGKGLATLLAAPWKIIQSVSAAWSLLKEIRPVCVLGMGGFAAGPGGVAAKLAGVPLVIHEQNAVAGTTNRLLAHVANCVLSAFPNAFDDKYGAREVGNPVRDSIEKIRFEQGGDDHPCDVRNILVVGGSLGALAINEIMPDVLTELRREFSVRIWHQTGPRHIDAVQAAYAPHADNRIEAFIDDMADAYAWADLVVCRSGALTVSELAVAGCPSVLVPFPFAIDDHQTANARWLVDAGAAVLVPQSTLDAKSLVAVLQGLLRSADRLPKMRDRALRKGRLDVAHEVAKVCMQVAYGRD